MLAGLLAQDASRQDDPKPDSIGPTTEDSLGSDSNGSVPAFGGVRPQAPVAVDFTPLPELTPPPGPDVPPSPTPVLVAVIVPTPAPTPSSAPTTPKPTPPPPPPATGINGRPYTAGSAWNTPIAGNAALDPNSSAMIGSITQSLTSDPTQYTYPVYFADANTPRYSVPCTMYRCTVVSGSGTSSSSTLSNVPIPNGARASAGSDAQIIIIDTTNGTEYDLWQVRQNGSSWSVSNGSVYNIYWDGMPSRYGSRGAGVPYYAGLIRPWEIAAGRIDHAIAFAYPSPKSGVCVWPASKTDGNSGSSNAIPEGARLQLDPSLTDADFAAWGLDRTGRIIARALQQYGMILIDVSGSFKIMAENLVVNPDAGYDWNDASIRLTRNTTSPIPTSAFRVLKLPTGSGGTHGGCLR